VTAVVDSDINADPSRRLEDHSLSTVTYCIHVAGMTCVALETVFRPLDASALLNFQLCSVRRRPLGSSTACPFAVDWKVCTDVK